MTSTQFLRSFARALRGARLNKGLTQEAVAEAARVHPTYLSRVETGAYTPTIAVAFRLSHAVGSSLWSSVREAEERSSTTKGSRPPSPPDLEKLDWKAFSAELDKAGKQR